MCDHFPSAKNSTGADMHGHGIAGALGPAARRLVIWQGLLIGVCVVTSSQARAQITYDYTGQPFDLAAQNCVQTIIPLHCVTGQVAGSVTFNIPAGFTGKRGSMHNSVAASSYLMSYYRAHPDELRSVDGQPRAFTTATLSGQTNGLLEEPAEMRRAEMSPTSKLLSAQPHNVQAILLGNSTPPLAPHRVRLIT
jgi:hypothetical protein